MQALFQKYSRYIGFFSTLLIVWLLVSWFNDIVTWVVLAWVISLLGSPLMKLLARPKIKKWVLPSSVRALLVLAFFYGVFGLFLYSFVPVLTQQGRNLARVDYASLMQSLEEPIDNFNDWLIDKGLSDGKKVHKNAMEQQKDSTVAALKDSLRATAIVATTTVNIDSIILAAGDTVTKTHIQLDIALNQQEPSYYQQGIYDTTALLKPNDSPFELLRKKAFQYISPSQVITSLVYYVASFFGNFLVIFTSVTFIAFFFLKDEQLFGSALKAAVPNKQSVQTDTALLKIKQLLTRYFSGVLLQICLITLYITTALSFFGVQNSLLIAFFAAIINVIPYIGPIIGAVFALLVTISSNLDVDFYTVTLPMMIRVVAVFASMQLLDGFVLQPYIFSNSVKAHPLEIFLVVVVGAKLGGVIGMVIAIPIYTILRVIAAVFLQEFKLVQKLTSSINEPYEGGIDQTTVDDATKNKGDENDKD